MLIDSADVLAALADEKARAVRVLEADRGIDPDEDNWHLGRVQGLGDAERIVAKLCSS